MNLYSQPIRMLLSFVVVLALLGAGLSSNETFAAAQPAAVSRGLSLSREQGPGGPLLRLRSPERFELLLDGSGIVEWRDLAGDSINLVAPARRLIAHAGLGGVPFVGSLGAVESSPVRARLVLSGFAGAVPVQVAYTIWAGGQVIIELRSDTALSSSLNLAPTASTGAALEQIGALDLAGQRVETLLLYLNAWTADTARPGDPGSVVLSGPSLAALPTLDEQNTLVADAAGGPIELTPPDTLVRQPRFRIAGWPGPGLHVRLGGTPLTAGVHYLADWDAASGSLTFQYLGLLPPGSPAERTFSFSNLDADPTIGLEILNAAGTAARALNAAGMLTVDANLPSSQAAAPGGYTGVVTTKDVFNIPYIQTWAALRLRATVTDPPANFSGVRFSVSGPGFSQSVDDTNLADTTFSALITLPRRADYSLTVSALVSGQPAAPSLSVAQVAYGRVLVTIGDSITAGYQGNYLLPGDAGYPVSSPPALGANLGHTTPLQPVVSNDSRNYYQSQNAADDLTGGVPAYENEYYTGYQVVLNNKLAQCLNSPVFLLNEGIRGLYTARDWHSPDVVENPVDDRYGTGGRNNALGKAAAYRSHFAQLGAEHVLLQLGTNDASSTITTTGSVVQERPDTLYEGDLRDVITALRQSNSALNIWLPRLPWRGDGNTADAAERQQRTQSYNIRVATIVSDLGAPTYLGPDFYTPFIDGVNSGLMDADLLHPNQAGYHTMADLWAQTLCSSAALPAEPPPATTTATTTTATTTTATTTTATTTTATTTTATTTTATTTTTTATASVTSVPSPNGKEVYLPLLRR